MATYDVNATVTAVRDNEDVYAADSEQPAYPIIDAHSHAYRNVGLFSSDKYPTVLRGLIDRDGNQYYIGARILNLCPRQDGTTLGYVERPFPHSPVNMNEVEARFSSDYLTLGIHPYDADQYVDERRLREFMAFIEEQSKITTEGIRRIVGIGECGVHINTRRNPTKGIQSKVFVEQVKLAHKLKLPLIVHAAPSDELELVINTIKAYGHKDMKIQIHGAQYHTPMMLQKALYAFPSNLYCSIGHTYADKISSVLNMIPRDKLMVESDQPYCCGGNGSDQHLGQAIRELANHMGKPLHQVARMTFMNTIKFFELEMKFIDYTDYPETNDDRPIEVRQPSKKKRM